MRLILSFASVLGLAVLALACGSDAGEDGQVEVVAGTTHLADLARNVAGERAAVTGILDPGSDPHDYEPRPSDAEALFESELILQSGGEVDLWLDELVESSGSDAPRLVLLDEIGAADPHWWQSPANAIVAVEAIRDELIAVDPAGRRAYERNASAYVADLERLDREIASCIASIPGPDRLLVTSHDALGAYAERYGIEVVGAAIPALSTQAQPSVGGTAELVELIRATGVETIFPEAGVSAELEQAIAEEAGAAVGGELWADALGPEGSDGETYVAAMSANTEQLVAGLSGGEGTCSIDVEG